MYSERTQHDHLKMFPHSWSSKLNTYVPTRVHNRYLNKVMQNEYSLAYPEIKAKYFSLNKI